jgi:glycosyltransferase involved in cell wall biosynthesis
MGALRVVHVMEATIGGTRRHLRDVARLQKERGLDVTVVASTLREPRVEQDLAELAARGVRVERVPMRRSVAPLTDLRHARAIARLLRDVRPDVVHSHSSKAGVLARAASLATGIGARVHTPHTFAFLFEAMFPPLQRAAYRRIEAFLARRTQAIVAVSAEEGETIARSGVVPADRLRVVPNGIDPAPWLAALPADRAELGLAPGRPLALCAGLLNVAKGQDRALEMLARPECAELDLVLAGDGELRPALERRARELGLERRVRMLGWRDDVPALVAAADLVLLPSRWEGMPYIVLEALCAGVPVVAAPVDGVRALVRDGETGFLARTAAPEDLAAAVGALLALPADERRRLGLRGRELVLAEHTAERMVERLLAIYAEVA